MKKMYWYGAQSYVFFFLVRPDMMRSDSWVKRWFGWEMGWWLELFPSSVDRSDDACVMMGRRVLRQFRILNFQYA